MTSPPGAGNPLYLAGPTGVGKSEAAVELAEQIGGEIVNADAFQLYAGLEALTAAPDERARRRAPHHLYGVVPLTEALNAAAFAEMARPVIAAVAARGRRPIVVGGSGLYLRALTHGLSDLPPGNAALRAQLGALSDSEATEWLAAIDPHGPEMIDTANRRRVERALELVILTGRPLREIRSAGRGSDLHPESHIHAVVLTRDRTDLHRRIEARARAMVEDGAAIEEVRRAGSDLSETAAPAIGIAQIRALLRGEIIPEDAIAAIATATRRYAKRQATWFRREPHFQSVCLSESECGKSAASRVLDATSEAPPH